MFASLDVPLIWAGLIAFAVVAYVVLDGFDLGIGILFAIEHEDGDRDVMVNSIAPVWDGNETWLVLGGGGLFAVFPLAYATIMPAMYPTIMGMLLALIFRGVAFEFRFRAATPAGRAAWDYAFFGGSTIAALCQGLTLGGLLQGIKVVNRAYAGGWWDWLTPFTVLCGLAVVVGYALLGASWLIWRTEGGLHASLPPPCRHARRRDAGADRRRQPVDAAAEPGFRGTLVRLAQHLADQPGAGAGGATGLAILARPVGVVNRQYAGGWWDWLTPFTVLCGVAVVVGYALLGACWLIWRTEGGLHDRCRRHAGTLGVAVLALIGVVSVWTPLLNPVFAARWFGWPGILLTSPVPVLMLVLVWLFWRGLLGGHHLTPFLCVLGWFLLCFAGLGISIYPNIVPPDISIWDAAAPLASQAFLLAGAVVLVPIILIYTGYAYWVFRGKVVPGTHYH